MNPLISPAQVDQILDENWPDFGTESVAVTHAAGRVLAEDLHADRPFPPYDRAMMDGIICRSCDGFPMTVSGLHPAGAAEPDAPAAGHCYEIMTGAVVPKGLDRLVPYEQIEIVDGQVQLSGQLSEPGQFIHRVGSDAFAGDCLLRAGTNLTPPCLGLAASVGRSEVLVQSLPRVALVSTGDELVPVDSIPEDHQIRRSNPVALESTLRSRGVTEIVTAVSADTADDTSQTLKRAISKAQLVIVSGGISKGKLDHVRPVLEALVGPPLFHGVSQKPGKPLGLWRAANGTLVIALPGNPNSCLTCLTRYILPRISPSGTEVLPIRSQNQLPLSHFQPVKNLTVQTPQNSGDEIGIASSTGFVEVPPGEVTEATRYNWLG